MLEAFVRHERGTGSLAFEEGVRRDGGPMGETVDTVGSYRTCRRDDGVLLLRGRGHLCRAYLTVAEEDGIGKRSSNIDAENAHELNDHRVAARRRRRRAR